MSHNMLENDVQIGLSMAWHNLTKIVETVTGFPFELNRLPCELNGKGVEGWSWIVGSDDSLPIGSPIANSFQFLSNANLVKLVNEAISCVPGAKIESLGTFGGRAKRYVTILLGDKRETFKIGDRVFNFRFGFYDAIDGTMKFRGKGANTCTVCANTYAIALGEKSDFDESVKHVKSHEERIQNLSDKIESFFNRSSEFENLMRSAETVAVTERQAHMTALGWLAEGKETSTRTLNTADRMRELFLTGKGNRGQTGLDLISAVTDYYTHESAANVEDTDPSTRWKQFMSSEIGSGSKMKDQFLVDVRTKDFRYNKSAVAQLVKAGELSLSLSS